ncbi:MAG: ATP-binding protein [Winogradskyella sp.]|nr:ATP-binding protein [Winogradskyella sp.]
MHAENQDLREAIKRRTTELEAQKRELEIEGALGRIRAQATAMKASTELLDIVVSMRNEFIKLGHEAHYFWHMMWLPNTYEKAMTSGDGTRIGFVMTLPRHIHGNIPLLAKWEKSKVTTVVYAMNTEEAIDYVDKMVDLGDFQNIDPQAPSHDDIRHIGGLTFIMARTTHGEIGYSLPGIVKNPPKEDLQILERFADAFDLAHRRFLDLQKAEQQAREVEIELALEKVRSRTMAMQHSDELQEASFLLDQQVQGLGIKTWGCAFNIYGEKDATEWFGNEAGILPTYTVPRKGIFKEYYIKGQKGESLYIKEFSGKACVDHYEYMSTLPVIGDVLRKLKETNNGFPTYQIDHVVFFKYGYLLFITKEHVPDAHDVFKRFAKVFEQTYTRFLDLQKAEAQAKESQIEASLERVRSKTMAMHSSQDVGNTMVLLFEELENLGIKANRNGIIILDEEEHGEIWTAKLNLNSEIELLAWNLDMNLHALTKQVYKAWKNKNSGTVYPLIEDDLKAYYKALNKATDIPVKFNLETFPQREWCYTFNFNEGFLYLFTDKEMTQEHQQIPERFASVFGQTYRRYQDLKKAEKQAREAQIEAALERVRSQAMAMRHSDDLVNCTRIVFDELENLNMSIERSGIGIFDLETKDCDLWTTVINKNGKKELATGVTSLTEHPLFISTFDSWLSQTPYSYILEGQELKDYYNLVSKSKFALSNDIVEKSISLTKEYYHYSPFTAGGLYFFSDTEPTDEDNQIIRRLAEVFDLTYTRFLDLQKAEAQAKEAQIEVALERIRSRSMAMQNTNELSDLVGNLLHELTKLDFSLTFCIINIVNEPDNSNMVWAANPEEGKAPESYYMRFEDYPFHHAMMREWKAQTLKFIYVMEGEEKEIYDDYLYTDTEFSRFPIEVQTANRALEKYVSSFVFSKFGGLQTVGDQALSDESLDILYRFGKVFDLTYTRFNDLQKAEEQAREAKIEAALERVRAKAMAMHNTSDLANANGVVFDELKSLGIFALRSGIGLIEAENRQGRMYATVESSHGNKLLLIGEISLTNHKLLESIFNHWNKKQLYCAKLNGQELKEYYELFLASYDDFPKPKFSKNEIQYGYFLPFKYGAFYAWTREPFDDDKLGVIKRFVRVIDLTYNRYFDLQKAEEQAREALKQSSLDRVRAEIASMRNAKDLERITPLIWSELQALGVPFFRCGVMIANEDTNLLDFYLSNPKGDALAALHLDFDSSVLTTDAIANWRKNEIYKAHWDQDQFLGFMKQLMSQGQIVDATTYQGGEQAPTSLTLQFVPFTQGMVYVGSELALSEEELELVDAIGKSLSVAYARYEDFTKLDVAKARAEKALLDLKAVQEQLIQQEKLASLGQLTAGIAHEIKNPLNFVNNFSDLSRELIEEVFIELERVVDSEAKEEITAILQDVRSNLIKVNEHGTRADGIVTSMLQHSRASGSKREPKPFNPLVKEFVNLSFHGMRAGKSPINVKIDLQLDPKVGDVTMISEDFSRVILNLSNNAFDAMRDKLNHANKPDDYLPELTVKTLKENEMVILSIGDNGLGISKDIQDKILQPFFTTKKGTEGTGLGLSITNDIIKAHRAALTLESTEGIGTLFSIKIPIQ